MQQHLQSYNSNNNNNNNYIIKYNNNNNLKHSRISSHALFTRLTSRPNPRSASSAGTLGLCHPCRRRFGLRASCPGIYVVGMPACVEAANAGRRVVLENFC
jgi:hypothetical protein